MASTNLPITKTFSPNNIETGDQRMRQWLAANGFYLTPTGYRRADGAAYTVREGRRRHYGHVWHIKRA